MSSRIEENEVALGFWLRLRPHGAEGDRSTLGVFKIIDLEIDVALLRHRPHRPRGRYVVLDPHCCQQDMIELDHPDLIPDERDLPAEQIGPEGAQRSWISTVQRDSTEAYLRHADKVANGPQELSGVHDEGLDERTSPRP